MSSHPAWGRAAGAAFVALLAASCGGPTAPSSTDGVARATPAGQGGLLSLAPSSSAERVEEFNCSDVEEVRVRFSDPGYVRGSRVGLYASYAGVPPGEKLLRVWWDYEHDATSFQDVALGEGEVWRDDPNLFDLEHLVEHVYQPVGPPERLVRAELIIRGKTGNCARNRVVVLSFEPPVVTATSGAPGACDGLRFCRLGDGTVRDTLTGLVWLENADCLGLRRFIVASAFAAALGSGQCGLSDGSVPGSWRLPTLAELASLVDARFHDPSLSNARGDGPWSEGDAFRSVESRFYWTTDTVEVCILERPGFSVLSFRDGEVRCRLVNIGFARSWPVRAP